MKKLLILAMVVGLTMPLVLLPVEIGLNQSGELVTKPTEAEANWPDWILAGCFLFDICKQPCNWCDP